MRHQELVIMAITSLLILSSAGFGAIMIQSNESVSSTEVDSEANNLYELTNYTILNATSDTFQNVFPDYDLYVVGEKTQIPAIPHVMAFNPATDEGFDTTEDYNDLLADATVLIGSQDKAIQVAKAFAEAGNVEFQLSRDVVNSTDSDRLNMTVEDSSARTLLGGYEVELTTWSSENGIVANWTIKLTNSDVTRAAWEIVAVDRGDHTGGFESTNFRVGMELVNEWEDDSHQLYVTEETEDGIKQLDPEPGTSNGGHLYTIATATNFDGSEWQIKYTTSDPPPDVQQLADALAKAGPAVYNMQVNKNPNCSSQTNPDENWGLQSEVPDCTLTVVITGGDLTAFFTTQRGDDGDFYVSRYVKPTMNALGWYLNPDKHDMENFTKTMLSHAHFHNLQYAAYEWGSNVGAMRGTFTESTARFAQTVAVPDVEHDPSSLFYGTSTGAASFAGCCATDPTGVNAFQLRPSRDACDQGGGYAHYWGLLFWQDGGTDTLRDLINTHDPYRFHSCETDMAVTVNEVLESPPDTHEGWDDSQQGFGRHVYTQNFTWEGKDWGAYMTPVYRASQTLADEKVQFYRTGDEGHHYVNIEEAGNVTLDCDGAPSLRVFLEDASGLTTRVLECGSPIDIDTSRYTGVTTHAWDTGEYSLKVS